MCVCVCGLCVTCLKKKNNMIFFQSNKHDYVLFPENSQSLHFLKNVSYNVLFITGLAVFFKI